ncbi:J domain-containing protein [Aneurinibacillus danicus]|uniref:J domain-containing protein n=1 Tax=Aneurinibacillus danicus TaxID=267746 RepID=A0A511VG07_9BACL|nr:J domain-containing protein [Aneurinibacillus danicus]GEN36493.1 hypothetical protein ADA01nite_39530 [Aneurinibacillus danicus]
MCREHHELRQHPERTSVTVTDAYLISVVQAVENLLPIWRQRLEDGLIRLDFAVEVGRKLMPKAQERLFDFLRDHPVPKNHESKVLLAFSFDMPEWAVLEVLRLYKQADKVRDAIIKYNDLMDLYEELMYEDFEYRFFENKLPKDEQKLSESLTGYRKRLQALHEQAPRFRDKNAYSRMYSDSSSSSRRTLSAEAANSQNIRQLLGVNENASDEEVKKRYRHLMKVLHPDRGGSAYLFDLVKKAYEAEK